MTTLLVASGGGHLKQLHRLLPRLPVDDDRLWITFDTGLSRSLLEGEEVHYAPYAHPHDLKGSARDVWFAERLLAKRKVHGAFSTGANLAVTTLPVARLRGAECHYVESATRSYGPSLAGRILQRLPGMHLHTQHRAWAKGRWNYAGSVFDGFQARSQESAKPISKLVVVLGSNDSYPFEALVHKLQSIIPPHVEVLWQLGATPAPPTLSNAHVSISADQLDQAMSDADAVIAHAGTGIALSAMECGRLPLLVPRRAQRGEHIDDHQEQTASQLQASGLASAAEADEITWADVEAAARWIVETNHNPPALTLG